MTDANQAAHRAAVVAAENVRQVSKAANPTAAGHLAADKVYYKAVLASARTNGVSTGALNTLHALHDPAGEYGQNGDT